MAVISEKADRLVLFFVFCSIVGVIALFCLLAPKINPDLMNGALFQTPPSREFQTGSLVFAETREVEQKLREAFKTANSDVINFQAAGVPQPKEVAFKSADGTPLFGWYWEKKDAPKVILWSPDSVGGRRLALPLGDIKGLLDTGNSVFTYDYRGYWHSPGKPTPDLASADGLAAYQCVTNNLKIPANKVVLAGNYFGGYVTARVAKDNACSAIIFYSPMLSIKHWFDEVIPTMWMIPSSMYPDDGCPIVPKLIDNKTPILVLGYPAHDATDELFDALRQPKSKMQLARPSDASLYYGTKEFTKNINSFLASLPN